MTKKETLIGTRANRATAVAGFRGVGFWNNQHRYAIPGCLVFNKLGQLIVGHRGDDTVHPLAFSSLPDALQVSQNNGRVSFPSLIHYLPRNLMTDSINLSLLGMSYFLDDIEQLSLPQPLSQPGIVSPNMSNLLAQELGLDTVVATDNTEVSFPQIHSKDMASVYNRFGDLSLDSEVDKPAILFLDEFCFPKGTILRNITMRFKPKPDATSYPKARELKPIRSHFGPLFLQPDNIPAKDNRVVSMLWAFNLLKKPLCLLLGSRIKVSTIAIKGILEGLIFPQKKLLLSPGWLYDLRLNRLFCQHPFLFVRHILAYFKEEKARGKIEKPGSLWAREIGRSTKPRHAFPKGSEIAA